MSEIEVDQVDKNNQSVNSANKPDELAQFIDSNAGSKIGDSEIAKNMRASRFSTFAGPHGLSTFSGALAIISTCVGGGIVGLPLAYYRLGLITAVILNILVIIATVFSTRVYLAIKDALPDKPESLYEIGYMLIGRSSIFIQAGILIINSFGLCMIYFIVFGDTFGQLMASLTDKEFTHDFSGTFYTKRWFYDILLAAVLLPIVLKKELAELAWVSYVLFSSLGLFIVLSFIMLVFDSRFEAYPDRSDFWAPKVKWSTISALNVTMIAYSYQQNVFPIYTELKNKTNEQYAKVNLTGLLLTFSIYTCVAIICMFMFGAGLESSVLDNFGHSETADGKPFWEAVIVELAFMVVLTCHIPFIFFSGKEAVCTIIDEIDRKSISSALWHKLQGNSHFSKRLDAQIPPNPNLPIPGEKQGFDSMLSTHEKGASEADVKASLHASKLRSKAMMSHVSAAVAQRLAYKDMKASYYYIASLIFYSVILLGAILIVDITTIFDFVSAIAISALAFFIPSILYRQIPKKFPQELENGRTNMCLANLFLALGCVNFILGLMSTVINIIGVEE